MSTHYHWGVARFGKSDGFALTEQLGALLAFGSPGAQAQLSHALQLRQEEIRPHAGAEILGLTSLTHQRDHYRLLTLYQYRLDRYRRDGYTALTLALKNCRGDSRGWLKALRLLATPGSTPAHCGFDESGHPPFAIQPDAARGCATLPTAIFIPLAEGSLEEEVALLDAWQQQLEEEYQQLYASASPQVRATVDPRRISLWASNPFWRVAPQPVATVETTGRKPREQARPLRAHSLVHAHAADGEHQWTRTTSPTVQHPPPPLPAAWRNPWLWGTVAAVATLLGGLLWWAWP